MRIRSLPTVLVFLCITFSEIGAQSYFSPLGDFTSALNINLLEAKVNGVNLEAGDEIGIFDGDLCVGTSVLENSLEVALDKITRSAVAGSDDSDSDEKDGFTVGNSISYKIWDKSENEIIDSIQLTYYNPQDASVIAEPKFVVGASVYVSLLASHNYRPKSNAGENKSVNEGENSHLDGSGSFDFDGDSLTFIWSDIDSLGLMEKESVYPFFLSPNVDEDKEYRVVLTVNDGGKNAIPDTIKITVLNVLASPFADAGPDFEIIEGENGLLDGSNSLDPDNLDLTFFWEIIPNDFSTTLPDSAITKFIAPLVDFDCEYLAVLTITNSNAIIDKDTAVVRVKNINVQPVADAGADFETKEGVIVELSGAVSYDPDNASNSLEYQWISLEGAELNHVDSVIATFETPHLLTDTIFRFTLVVYDGDKFSAPDTVYIKINHKNLAPVAVAGDDFSVREGGSAALDGTISSDPEGKSITFIWYSDYLFLENPKSAKPVFVAPNIEKDTTVLLTLVVNDGELSSQADSVFITIRKSYNNKPTANAGIDIVVNEGESIQFDASASFDSDGDSISYNWSLGEISNLDSDKIEVEIVAPEVQKDVSFSVILVVNDGFLSSEPDTIQVTILQINKSPVWIEIPFDTVFLGYNYHASIQVSDPDSLDDIVISALELPEWMSLEDYGDGTAILLSDSVPRREDLTGKYSVLIKAFDGKTTIESRVELNVTVLTNSNDFITNDIRIYPNPTSEWINIFFDHPCENYRMKIFNQNGSLLKEEISSGQITEFNLSKFHSGIYYVQIITQGKTSTTKIVLN